MSKAEEKGLVFYPIKNEWEGDQWGGCPVDINAELRTGFIEGYNHALADVKAEIDKRIAEYAHDGSNPNQLVWSELQALWNSIKD